MFTKLFSGYLMQPRFRISPRVYHYSQILSFFESYSTQPKIRENNTPKTIYEHLKQFSENSHAHSIMHSMPAYRNILCDLNIPVYNSNISEKEFNNILSKNWRQESATNIVKAFKTLRAYSCNNNILLSDTCFDKLVDGLMDRCQDLTDNELSELLSCIREYPVPEYPTSHNFNDIWSALDDVCFWRHKNWSTDTLLLFADHWYLLGLAKYSDYVKECIKRLARKVRHLTGPQLVHTLFIINVCRKPWDMFDFEYQLEKHIDKLTLNEIAIVSMSFFKTETPIKGTFLLSHIVHKLLKETTTVNEITLSAILKVIRYSPHLPIVDILEELLTKLVPEIDRFTLLSCVHIILTGTNAQFFHPEILTKVSEKFLSNICAARLKDLERLAFALSLYNFNPPTSKPIYDEILKEISNPVRLPEIEKHPRSFICCVQYLGLQQIYPYEHISKILDPVYLRTVYGANHRSIGREILFIDASLDIDCPDYKGNRLDKKRKFRLSKWAIDPIPDGHEKKLNAGNRLMLDLKETIKNILGGDEYVHIDHILPHFQKADIIFCKNKEGMPIKINHLCKNPIGEIMYPEKNGNIWYATIAASWNSYIRGTTTPTGILFSKIRQLQKIGYKPIMVPWHDFAHLSQQQKEEYIKNKLR